MRRSRPSVPLLPALLILVLLLPAGPALGLGSSINGTFLATVTTEGDYGAAWTLPAGRAFPQATLQDMVFAADQTHYAFVGATLDFLLGLGELGQDGTIQGRLRLASLYNVVGQVAFVGTFDLELEEDAGPYTISGPLVGDQYSLYLAGIDTHGDDSKEDDVPFLIRVNGVASEFFMSVGDQVFGSAQVLLGDPLSVARATLSATRDRQEFLSPLGSQFGAGHYFNQAVPPGDPGLLLAADTSALVAGDMHHSGTLTGDAPFGGSVDITSHALVLTSGAAEGTGIHLGRFVYRGDDGRLIEGFLVGDLDPEGPTGIPSEGFLLAPVASRRGSGDLFFGHYAGLFDGDPDRRSHLGADVDLALTSTDSTPPDAIWAGVVDADSLEVGSFGTIESVTRDLNGWTHQKSVQLALGPDRRTRTLTARYDAARDSLSLYHPTLKTWVGSCAPGSPGTVRVPEATLSCQQTAVTRTGEYLVIDWAVKPTRKLLGEWPTWLKVSDRTKLVTGWRLMPDEVEVQPAD